jgi:predicted DNA-binding transcriptional regulator AlpA
MPTAQQISGPRPALEPGRVYRLAELAQAFGMSVRTLRRAAEARRFPAGRRIGRYRFWSGRVVLDWLGEARPNLESEPDQTS